MAITCKQGVEREYSEINQRVDVHVLIKNGKGLKPSAETHPKNIGTLAKMNAITC